MLYYFYLFLWDICFVTLVVLIGYLFYYSVSSYRVYVLLLLVARTSRLLEIYSDEASEWETIGRRVFLPYSPEKSYHPEFAGIYR